MPTEQEITDMIASHRADGHEITREQAITYIGRKKWREEIAPALPPTPTPQPSTYIDQYGTERWSDTHDRVK